jgi:hypothetical protein
VIAATTDQLTRPACAHAAIGNLLAPLLTYPGAKGRLSANEPSRCTLGYEDHLSLSYSHLCNIDTYPSHLGLGTDKTITIHLGRHMDISTSQSMVLFIIRRRCKERTKRNNYHASRNEGLETLSYVQAKRTRSTRMVVSTKDFRPFLYKSSLLNQRLYTCRELYIVHNSTSFACNSYPLKPRCNLLSKWMCKPRSSFQLPSPGDAWDTEECLNICAGNE